MKLLLITTLAVLLACHARAQPLAAEAPSTAASAVPQAVAGSNQDREWRPNTKQQERLLQDVLAYLTAKDERRFADAYTYFSPAQKTAVAFDRWETDMRAFYGSAGRAEGRTLRKVTWYKNPANAPPGVYAAVDFHSQFTELSLHCGFISLQQQMDGSFRVSREEENSISKQEMMKLTPEALQRIRAQYRC